MSSGADGSSSESLLDSCKSLDVETFQRLLPVVGATVQDSDGLGVLACVASSQHEEIVDPNSTHICRHTKLLDFFKANRPAEYTQQLAQMDSSNKSVLHFAVLSDCGVLLSYLEKDGSNLEYLGWLNRTPLNVAAMQGKLQSVRYLIQTGKCNLESRDSEGLTPLMNACQKLRQPVAEELLGIPGIPKQLTYRTEDDETVAICVLRGGNCLSDEHTCKHIRMMQLIQSHLGQEVLRELLLVKTVAGCSAALIASKTNCELLMQFVRDNGCPLDEPDNDGDTPMGQAATSGATASVRFLLNSGCNMEHRNKNGLTPFLKACLRHRYETAKYLAEAGASVQARDYSDNSALHTLCMLRPDQLSSFHKLLDWLSGLEECTGGNYLPVVQKMQDMNLSRHSVLMTLSGNGYLENFLQHKSFTSTEGLKKHLPSLFRNPNGMNVLHVIVSKHSLEKLQQDFIHSTFADLWDKLIDEKVQNGFYKGYGCMHFACQMGHVENINYLLTNAPGGIALQDRLSSDCPSPMEILVKHRHERLLKQLTAITFQHLIESLDDVQTALSLPPAADAKQALLPLCDPDLKGIVVNPQLSRDELYCSGTLLYSTDARFCYPDGVRLFYLALKDDSVDILRHIIALGFWSHMSKPNSANVLNQFLCQLIAKCSTKDAKLIDVLPNLTGGFEQYLSWSPTDENRICFDLPTPSLLGIAIRSGRINIAKDLILLDQYHLIPTCLLVMDECQFLLEDGKALPESVEDLRSFALNVALNSMDEVDKAADKDMKSLLHAYIGGRFHTDGSTGAQGHGPKFSSLCFSQQQGCTMCELGVESSNHEIVASSCFLSFIKSEWSTPSLHGAFQASPLVKYYLHSASLVLFLLLLTYFVCFLMPSTGAIDIVMYVFAVSFAVHESIDFWQVLTKTRRGQDSRSNRYLKNTVDYFTDVWNYLDISAIGLLLIGLIWKSWDDAVNDGDETVGSYDYFAIRMILSTSHLIWGFRFLSFLRTFELLGPSITMLKTLLSRDLLPFLIIFMTMCLSFGVFFFNLLHPDSRSYSPSGGIGSKSLLYMFSIYTRPLLTSFGDMDTGDLASCENPSAEWSNLNETNLASDASCTHPVGTFHYRKYLILPFLFLINLTMLNVLIAKFSLTVNNMEDVAYMIWRRCDADLMMDYKRAPTIPPPFTAFWFLFFDLPRRLLRKLGLLRNKTSSDNRQQGDYKFVNQSDNPADSWWDKARLDQVFQRPLIDPDESEHVRKLKEFFLFQARTFHRKRKQLPRPRKDHGSAVEKLQVDIQRLNFRF